MKKVTKEKLVEIYGKVAEFGSILIIERGLNSHRVVNGLKVDSWAVRSDYENWETILDNLFDSDILKKCEEFYQEVNRENSSFELIEGNYISHNPNFIGYRFFFKDGTRTLEIMPMESKYLSKPYNFKHYE